MNRFELARATSTAEARELFAGKAGSVYKAGGIDLLDHMKEHLAEPPRVVDLKRIPGLDAITVEADGALRIGALATLAKVAAHEGVRKSHPALARACGEAASPQIRNVATIGGNLLQRPRCWYYRLESYPCAEEGRRHLLRGRRREQLPRPVRRRADLRDAPVERGAAARRLRRQLRDRGRRRACAPCRPGSSSCCPRRTRCARTCCSRARS